MSDAARKMGRFGDAPATILPRLCLHLSNAFTFSSWAALWASALPQHLLCFRPLPHGQSLFRGELMAKS